MSTLTIGHEILICDEPALVSMGRWLFWLGVMCACVGILICIMDYQPSPRLPRKRARQQPAARILNHEGHQLF
jgi:hypothetical protein